MLICLLDRRWLSMMGERHFLRFRSFIPADTSMDGNDPPPILLRIVDPTVSILSKDPDFSTPSVSVVWSKTSVIKAQEEAARAAAVCGVATGETPAIAKRPIQNPIGIALFQY